MKRQEMWTFTAQGWLIVITFLAAFMFFVITNIQPFLAPNSPIKSAEILVIEGWVPDYVVQQAFREFQKGHYRSIVTVGGNLERGSYLVEYKNVAEVSAATLKKLGLPSEKVVAVPTPPVIKDRSYAAAKELQRWLLNSGVNIKAMNLVSWDVHAGRSWLLFKRVFSPEIKVGVIAPYSRDYEPKKWWASSEGFRRVLNEAIAYIYALLN